MQPALTLLIPVALTACGCPALAQARLTQILAADAYILAQATSAQGEADRRKREAARAEREDRLLELALSGSPDYPAALRRAAIQNVQNPEPDPARGRGVTPPRSFEQRLATEEARLSAAVERRRRERLAQ